MEFIIYVYDVLTRKEEEISDDCPKKCYPQQTVSGRLWFVLERRIIEEKLKRQQAKFGYAELIYPPSPLSQYEKWKLARTKPGDYMTYEKSLEISQRIVSS